MYEPATHIPSGTSSAPQKPAADPLADARLAVTEAHFALDQARQAVQDAETAYGRAVAALVALESPPIVARDGETASALDQRRAVARTAAVLAATGDRERMKADGLRKARQHKPRPALGFFRRSPRA